MKYEETEAKRIYNKMVTLVIDADSLIYRACHVGEKEALEEAVGKNHPLFTTTLDFTVAEKQRSILHSMINGIVWKVRKDLNYRGIDIEEYKLVFTPKKKYCDANGLKMNFRYEIIDTYNLSVEEGKEHPDYKANRKGMTLPEGISEMFEYVATLENAYFSDHCEADDVVHFEKVNHMDDVVIACLDKDIYMGTPSGDLGHYNFNRNEWIHTSEDEANLFFYRQCMTGDSSDGIKGIHRYGPKTAEKDLPEWTDHEDMWDRVLQKFEEKGYSEDYALLMMRLVNLGQLTSDGKIALWEPLYGWE